MTPTPKCKIFTCGSNLWTSRELRETQDELQRLCLLDSRDTAVYSHILLSSRMMPKEITTSCVVGVIVRATYYIFPYFV